MKIQLSSNQMVQISEKPNIWKTKEKDRIPKKKRDRRLQNILRKFNSGRKLNQSELQYLKKECPEIYQKVQRVSKEREQLEREVELSQMLDETSKEPLNEDEISEKQEEEDFKLHNYKRKKKKMKAASREKIYKSLADNSSIFASVSGIKQTSDTAIDVKI